MATKRKGETPDEMAGRARIIVKQAGANVDEALKGLDEKTAADRAEIEKRHGKPKTLEEMRASVEAAKAQVEKKL